MGGNIGYSNGFIPDSMLVTFNTGWNSTDGDWKHQLSPGTYAKHLKLVALARARTGRTLEITEGWGAYRPYDSQVLARRLYGLGAAYPGTSSHGGFWENQQTMAMDYGNWGSVYDWDRSAFYQDVRNAGLAPGLIHPSRGNNYPDEPWHVVDLDPWAAPIHPEEDDMAVEDLYTAFKKKGGQPVKAGQKVNLHINDAKDVTVALGAAKHVSGNLAFTLSGGKAYEGAVQVTPVVRTYKDGKEAGRSSLRARETVFTGGDTLGEVAVNCALRGDQRLSFEIGGSAQDFTVKSAVFRGMKIT